VNLLDWLLVALVLTYALSGYWQGFVTGAAATAGLLLGGLTGVWLAPIALGDANPSVLVSLGALFIVILCATLGQAVFQYGGGRLRDTIQWQPFRAVDAVGGAVLSGVAVLLVAWALGVAIAGSGISGITPMVRESAILAKVDQTLPTGADGLLNTFNNVVGTTFFPRYLEPFAPERIVPVGPGPQRLLTDPDVVRAEPSVVKIQSVNSCGRGIEGSGFLFATDRVMTNAHVVAGVRSPQVRTTDGHTYDARVVLYDSGRDVAVLYVPDLDRTPLSFAGQAKPRDSAVVAGYPENGPFRPVAARIRAVQEAQGPDIYQSRQVTRQIYSIYAVVRPGNSGGPLLATEPGKVYGVVFAAAVDDANTGYALTAQEVSTDAARGATATAAVSTQDCD